MDQHDLGRICELWRYPVKSVGGERVSSIDVSPLGLAYDRGWAIVHAGTNNGLTARRNPELLFASATVTNGEVSITLPDGTVTNDDADLSAWLGFDVELRRAGDEGATYEVPLDFEADANWVSWTGPSGAFHDSPRSRLSLVSTSSLGNWDVRRFRCNIVVDGAGEDALVGSQISVGSVMADVIKQIDRCVMVTRPQPGLDRDIDILKTINNDRASMLAVGVNPSAPGHVAVGDVVSPV